MKTIDIKQVRNDIKALGATMGKAQDKVNTLLIASIDCMMQHDDTDTLTMLYKALPSSCRKGAFKQAVEELLPVNYAKNAKGVSMFRFKRHHEGVKKEGETGATSYNPFYEKAKASLAKEPWYARESGKEHTKAQVARMFANVGSAETQLLKYIARLEATVEARKGSPEGSEFEALLTSIKPAVEKFIN